MLRKTVIQCAVLIHILMVTAPFAVCWYIAYADRITNPFYQRGNYFLVFLFILLYGAFGHTYDAFLISYYRVSEMIYSQVLALVVSDGMIYVVICLLSKRLAGAWPLLLVAVAQAMMAAVWSLVSQKLYFAKVRPRRSVIVHGVRSGVEGQIREYRLEKKFGVFRTVPVEECVRDVPAALQGADVVFVCGVSSHDRNIILKYCAGNGVHVFVIPRIGDILMGRAKRIHMLHLPIMLVEGYSPSLGYLFAKRLSDIVISLILLVFASPVMLATAAAIRLHDGGPVFYRQCRLTKDGRRFHIVKFRSMRVDAEREGIRLSTGASDSRVTLVGRVIRRLRIDELPQLFNILMGDMSLVGPRPERPEIEEQYRKELPEFRLRLQVKAGLTGYAQVYGKYNTMPYDKLQMDLMYIVDQGMIEDLRIILATIKILFMPESTEGVAEGQEKDAAGAGRGGGEVG